MADPFEVRMRFSSQLQHLNASVASAQKAAQYALKYKDMDEDLHSCILEQVERVSEKMDCTNNMNTRANIMYFIEHFLDLAQRDGHSDYIRMMQRDIIRVVDAVAPDDGSGAANVKVVRKVLIGLQNKGFLEHQAVVQIEDVIKERGTNDDDLGLASPNGDVEMSDAPASESKSRRRPTTHGLDKRQVEQRIEEDRERHKRERERIWAVPKGEDAEMTKLWEETSDFGDDDDRLLTEEEEDFTKEMEMQRCQHLQTTNGNHH
ncbi:CTD kinase subunit gamma [Trichoderma asperellum]|uniref:CTD kinase subunit gamma n=1 Tax=Trichoderma asperellum TaxID=101201 RepID=A0A6V8QID2_TRIAP|nr:CTD kinase subunit gamma [Trichoderma asperellum]